MSDDIDIKGLDKAEVLRALYNASQPLGMGFLSFKPEDMTREQAALVLEKQRADLRGTWFDYLHGRVMKVDISENSLNPRLYDRDNGEGAALKALRRAGLIS